MNKFILLLLIFLVSFSTADDDLKPVRLDAVSESWLAGDREKCYSQLLKIYDTNRDSFIVVYNLGYINFLKGRFSQALSFLHEANKIDPTYPYVHLVISKIYARSGNPVSAKNALLLGLKSESDNYKLQLELARIYNKLGKTEEAIDLYSDLIDDFDDEWNPRTELATIYRRQKNFDDAKKLLEFDEDHYPESNSLLEKYRYFRDTGDFDDAKQILLDIYSAYPNSEGLKKYQDTLHIKYKIDKLPQPEKIPKYNYIFNSEEKLNYLVEYGFIKLGSLKVRVENELQINGRKVYQVIFYIDSNPKYDFIISLHHIYESYIDAETLSAIRSRLYTPDSEINFVRMYYFDYDKNIFHSYTVKTDGRYDFVEKDLPNAAQDGTSMLYLARGLVSNKSGGKTIVMINEKFKFAIIDYLNEFEDVEVNDSDVRATKIFAQAKFSGVAGMSGDAYGWFSTDNQAVPLEGKIEILVGSITVRVNYE